MTRTKISQRVKNILVEQLGVLPEIITDDAAIIDDLGADSLDLVELIMAFEDEFDILITDEEAEKILRVGDAIHAVDVALADAA